MASKKLMIAKGRASKTKKAKLAPSKLGDNWQKIKPPTVTIIEDPERAIDLERFSMPLSQQDIEDILREPSNDATLTNKDDESRRISREMVEYLAVKIMSTEPGISPTVAINHPPDNAMFLLHFLPRKQRDEIIGNILEDYTTKVFPKYGERRADLWCWIEVLRSFGSTFGSVAKKLAFLRIFGWMGELMRRLGH